MNAIALTSPQLKRFFQKMSWPIIGFIGLLMMGVDVANAQGINTAAFCFFINNFKLIIAAVAVIALMVWGAMYMMKKADIADVGLYIISACVLVGAAGAIIMNTGLMPPSC
ncbi:hypothetical protein ICN48_06895 [Polynucleobacter sp. JS-Safj-400b-B2]|uniref:hypothetical protein n=1 Tax=Polynucleobacter sp. JS-Safj-400b-B2 TaxID=2576921 RepID=UPI001C0D51DE|nr:hypothetical protein [Polynucleobacter sp. JS-Safj-400b-B2]MBU3625960.1 hypothetical protein [Polynucleobacter sp. JS-Safj-400b-B2]